MIEVAFDPLKPGRLGDELADLGRPSHEGRLMRVGDTTLVANDYRIEIHPDDYASAFLAAIGADLGRQLEELIAEAVDRRAIDGFKCIPAPGFTGSAAGCTADSISVVFHASASAEKGTAQVTWKYAVPPPPETEPVGEVARASAAGCRSARIQVIAGACKQKVIDLESAVTPLGRRTRADGPVFADSAVSRDHAEIRRSGGNYVLKDLGSTHGTMVRGAGLAPGAEHRLRDGDEIELASVVRLLFRLD